MKIIWILFLLFFILTSCSKELKNIKIENKKIVESDTIEIQEIKDQPNF